MSLILDALNRSESDRDGSDPTPGLKSVHGPGGELARPLWQRLAWPGLTLLFAVIALLAWWGSGADTDKLQPVSATPPPAEAPAIAEPAVAVRSAAPSVATAAPRRARVDDNRAGAARPAPGFSDDVAALYTRTQAAGASPEEPAAPPPAAEQAVAAADSSPVQGDAMAQMERMAELAKAARAARSTRAQRQPEPARSPARSEPASSEPAYDVDALALAAEEQLSTRPSPEPLVQHEAPFITDLRQSQKDQIPSIFYSQHNWSSSPAERSVVLNGQERREGQQVKSGLRLVEILETSIVLSFNGTEFQLRSLNSWVNL